MIKLASIIFVSSLLCVAGCAKKSVSIDLTELKNIPRERWEKLSQLKIYFGHQSVGYNIVDGINDILREMPVLKLNIKETSNPVDFSEAVWGHSKNGKNRDPYSKCADFTRIMESGVGEKVHVAFFKFCYVDIMKDADPSAVFDYYVKSMSEIEAKYPSVKFAHFTVPLTCDESGIKGRIKRYLKKSLSDDQANIKRQEFNALMRQKYAATGMLFDLAKYESSDPAGGKAEFESSGKTYPCLAPCYTDDGGHLNKGARGMVAKELLLFLLKIS